MVRAERKAVMLIKNYYNPDLKEEFISVYNDGDSEGYAWNSIFLRSAQLEESLKKDCCNFTFEEIERLLIEFRSSSVLRLSSILSILSAYTDFCIERNFSMDNQNHFRNVDRNDLAKYVDKQKAECIYLTEKEMLKIADSLDSSRDQYAVLGLFYGIVGKDLVDILKLKVTDLLGDNKIRIQRTGEIRKVPHRLYNIMEKAGSEYKVTFKNGSTWKFSGDTIYKGIVSSNSSIEVNKAAFTKRIAKLRLATGMPLFSTKAIVISGFCSAVFEYIDYKDVDLNKVVREDYVQALKNRYAMSKKNAQLVKLLRNYSFFVQEKEKENN